MNYKTLYILLITIFCSHLCLYSQSIEEVLKKVNAEYTSNKYLSYDLNYNLYKKENDIKVYESYSGIFKKNTSNFIYQKINKTEFILKGNFCLKVIHEDKTIDVSKAEPFILGDFSIKPLLEYCKVKEFKLNKGSWIIVLEPKQYTDLPYSKIVITVNGNYFITKQMFYFNSGIDFSKDYTKSEISNPVLEIRHSNHTRDKVPESLFSLGKFISFEGNIIKPSKTYSGYNIEDYR